VTLTPTAVWRVAPSLVRALDEHLGPPLDSYVNGSQVWLTSDGPGGATLEWRLHPVAGYRPPSGLGHEDVWDEVLAALGGGEPPDALPLGDEQRALDTLWDGLECFPPHGDEIEPAVLAAHARETLGVPPDAAGLVDHERIGKVWERARGEASLVDLLLDELESATR
jgi:hypothetical protein